MNELAIRLKSYLDGLNPRERRMVIGGGAFLLVFLLYQLIWLPIVGRASKLEEIVIQKQQDLIWMQQAALEVRELGGSAGSRRTRPASLLGVIERTARQSKLGDSIRKVQPEGKNGVRVWLDKAPFDVVITWLDDLQSKQGVTVANFSVERQLEPGRVNARLLIETQ